MFSIWNKFIKLDSQKLFSNGWINKITEEEIFLVTKIIFKLVQK